jgi:hypothetical protein
MNLLFEAILVGLFFLPVYWVAEKFGFSKWITLVVAGALFHIVADLAGLNRAYCLSKA